MTRSRQKGENEITREVNRRIRKSGEDPCEVLAQMRREARKAKDTKRLKKIREAEKFFGCHERRKRGKRL
jgi:hypothetical protein